MPEIVLLILSIVAIPMLGWGAFRLGIRNSRAGIGSRMAAARAFGMILLLSFGLLGGIVGSIATGVIPCLYLLGWGKTRGDVVTAA